MARLCLFILCTIIASISADFNLANKRDAQLGSILLSLSRLPSQRNNNLPAATATSSTTKTTSTTNGAAISIGGPVGGNTKPVNFIPVSGNGNSFKPNGSPISTTSGISSNTECVQRSMRDFRPHVADCSKFRLCMFGRLVDMDCPQGSVYHTRTSSCVPRGSIYDLCTTSRQACAPGVSGRAAHPHHCARYYQCDRPAQNERWEEHLQECPYPQLFNYVTLRCEHFSTVDCGSREEPRDPCEYRANGCEGHISCVPCTVRFPSCRGRSDGINPWTGRPGSPDYVVCSDQRVLYHGRCSQTGKGVQIFDEKSGGCVTLNHIPY